MPEKIDKHEVQHVAHLAKLNFNPDELSKVTSQILKIMKMFKSLDDVDTSNVEPTYTVADQRKVARPDKPENWGQRNALLQNAPDIMDGLIRVPVIVKQQKNERHGN